jgi:hypothetical protein
VKVSHRGVIPLANKAVRRSTRAWISANASALQVKERMDRCMHACMHACMHVARYYMLQQRGGWQHFMGREDHVGSEGGSDGVHVHCGAD